MYKILCYYVIDTHRATVYEARLSLSLVYIFRYFYNLSKFKKLYLPVYNTLLYTWSNTLDRRGVVVIISQRDRLNMFGWFGCEIYWSRRQRSKIKYYRYIGIWGFIVVRYADLEQYIFFLIIIFCRSTVIRDLITPMKSGYNIKYNNTHAFLLYHAPDTSFYCRKHVYIFLSLSMWLIVCILYIHYNIIFTRKQFVLRYDCERNDQHTV